MAKLNILYTFDVMAINCDVIMPSLAVRNSDLKQFKKDFFRINSCCSVNVHKLLYQ